MNRWFVWIGAAGIALIAMVMVAVFVWPGIPFPRSSSRVPTGPKMSLESPTDIRSYLSLPSGELRGEWVIVRAPGGMDWAVVLVERSGSLAAALHDLPVGELKEYTDVEMYLLPGLAKLRVVPPERSQLESIVEINNLRELGPWGNAPGSPIEDGCVMKHGDTVIIVAYTM
jgi:hypothetical protein